CKEMSQPMPYQTLLNEVEDDTPARGQVEILRESEALNRGLIESAFDGVVVHQGGIIRYANRAYAEMFGYEADELAGRNILELTAPEQRELVRSLITGEETLYETVGWKKDGTRINVEVSPAKCLYEGEHARVAAVRDITERKRGEERLRESERRFRQLAENINEVFWLVDPDECAMLYVSPAYEEIWGRTCESLYERPDSYLESVHPGDQ